MKRVRIIVEGQTEASFVEGPLYSYLLPYGVGIHPVIIGVSGHRGGRVNYQRVKKDVIKTLKQDRSVYCSSLFDLYGLEDGFPVAKEALRTSGAEKVVQLEQAMRIDMMREEPELRADTRFIPYIQIYEFEGLLFSDPAALARGMFRPDLESKLSSVRGGFTTPEDINDSPETAPSKRILALDRRYNKVISGTLAADFMGIDVIKLHCPRFRQWVERLAAIGAEGS